MHDLPIKLECLSFLNVTNVKDTHKTLAICQAMKYGIGGNIDVMVCSNVRYAFSCNSS
jgi:hypothetical protein